MVGSALIVALGWMAGCVPSEESGPPTEGTAAVKAVDADGDGDPDGTDCDDGDPAVHAGASETCDATDEDCDGIVDDGACPCADDTDGDHAFLFCTTPATWADAQAACASWGYHLADVEDAAEEAWLWAAAEALDPGSAWWHGANDRGTEGTFAWDGGADTSWSHWRAGEPNDYGGGEDCAAFADDGGGAWNDKACTFTYAYVCEAGCVWSSWYADADGDGFGDPSTRTRACEAPVGTVADATDCDDADPGVYPGGVEACGGADEDCDGLVDDADGSVSAGSLASWHPDADGDGYGDAATVVDACDAPVGHVADASDCDDGDAAIAPGAAEVAADGVDQDCDGSDGCTWYADADGDGYGDAAAPHEDCGRPAGYAATADDCDDGDASVFPGAAETWYDGVDGDCAGGSDYDADGDGADASGAGGPDCDDSDAGAHPGASETCDATDEDCDGGVDEDACAVPVETFDGHSYLFFPARVSWEDAREACAALGYHLADVHDAAEDAWLWAAAEAADPATGWWHGLSDRDVEGVYAWDGGSASAYTNWRAGEPNDYGGAEDCGAWADDGGGGWNDKGCTQTLAYVCEAGCEPRDWHADADGDGYGDGGAVTSACEAPAGTVADGTDCDDADAAVSPGAVELCDDARRDEDCDGLADDADPSVDPSSLGAFWEDADGDGYGSENAVAACHVGEGWSDAATDCDDADATVYPGAPEVEDGRDGDCDGAVELDDRDDDGLARADEEALGTDPEDPDSDADGLLDGPETGDPGAPADTDRDGAIDPLDADDDDDRLTTRAEIGDYDAADPADAPDDVDGDGVPDHLDLDSDDDGVPDGEDGFVDTDRDGIDNVEDPDDDGDGIPTATERAVDVDGDGTPDLNPDGDAAESWLDQDADGDGCLDGGGTELLAGDGPGDPNGNGVPAFADAAECDDWVGPAGGEPTGCGCASGGAAAGLPWLALLALGLGRARRPRAAATSPAP